MDTGTAPSHHPYYLSTEPLSAEPLSTEVPRPERPRTESLSTETPSPEDPRSEGSRADDSSAEPDPPDRDTGTSRTDPVHVATTPNPTGPANVTSLPSLPAVPLGREARSGWLKETAKDRDVALHCARQMRAEVRDLDRPFPCLLHRDCLASLTRGKTGEIVYKDGHKADSRHRFQTLAETRAAQAYGKARRLKPLELSLWRLRLLNESGLLELPIIAIPRAPESCPEFVEKVRLGFEHLIRCREWLDPGSPVSFARTFSAAWCEINPALARDALNYLVGHGVVVKVGETPSPHRRPTHLYRPGAA